MTTGRGRGRREGLPSLVRVNPRSHNTAHESLCVLWWGGAGKGNVLLGRVEKPAPIICSRRPSIERKRWRGFLGQGLHAGGRCFSVSERVAWPFCWLFVGLSICWQGFWQVMCVWGWVCGVYMDKRQHGVETRPAKIREKVSTLAPFFHL